jgi:hypothetical protein
MSKIVYFVPAPEMDERSIQAVKLNGFEVIPVILPPIDSDTELEAYLKQLSTQIRHERPVLVGGCFIEEYMNMKNQTLPRRRGEARIAHECWAVQLRGPTEDPHLLYSLLVHHIEQILCLPKFVL